MRNRKGSLHDLISNMFLELGDVKHGMNHGIGWQIEFIN